MIAAVKLLRLLPLPLLRALGAVFGWLLYTLHRSRRQTVQTNLRLCFPEWSSQEREAQVRKVFIFFAQSFLDRGWLWHAPEAILVKRLRLVGAIHELSGSDPTVLFAPHFVGMDAGWLAMNLLTPDNRAYAGIYAPQTSAAMTEWIGQGRARHSAQRAAPTQVSNKDGVRGVLKAIKTGTPLYVLPDMNYEPRDSLFVPFFGVPAATLSVLPRYAKLGGTKGQPAKVVPIVTRMTASGYDIQVHPAWQNYPSGESETDVAADTLRMNQVLERFVMTMPAQYYWVHRRFKDQPNGQSSPYKND